MLNRLHLGEVVKVEAMLATSDASKAVGNNFLRKATYFLDIRRFHAF